MRGNPGMLSPRKIRGDGVIVAVPNLITSQEFQAFLAIRSSFAFPMHFFTATDDDMVAEWFKATQIGTMTQDFTDGKLMIAGNTPASLEVPAELSERAPTIPNLNLLTIAKKGSDVVGCTIPSSLSAVWKDHPKFGEQFQAELAHLSETIRINDHSILGLLIHRTLISERLNVGHGRWISVRLISERFPSLRIALQLVQ